MLKAVIPGASEWGLCSHDGSMQSNSYIIITRGTNCDPMGLLHCLLEEVVRADYVVKDMVDSTIL
jgi:hypothetical protein